MENNQNNNAINEAFDNPVFSRRKVIVDEINPSMLANINNIAAKLGDNPTLRDLMEHVIPQSTYEKIEENYNVFVKYWKASGRDISDSEQVYNDLFGTTDVLELERNFNQPTAKQVEEKIEVSEKAILKSDNRSDTNKIYLKMEEENITVKKKVNPVIKWIILLPLAIIGSILIQVIWDGIISIKLSGAHYFKGIVGNLIQGFSLVYIGVFIAPKYKKTISIALVVSLIVIMIIFPLVMMFLDMPTSQEKNWFFSISSVIGALLTYSYLNNIDFKQTDW